MSIIDSDEGGLTNKSPSTVEVVSKDDIARKFSSEKASPRPEVSLSGATNEHGRQIMTIKVYPQTFIQMRGMSTYEEILKELNQQLAQYDLDDTPVLKKLLEKHPKRLSKSGNATKRYNDLLSFDQGK